MNEKTEGGRAEPSYSPGQEINEDTNVANSALDQEEQRLRIEELKLKVETLRKPEYRKIGTWTGLVAILVAISGIVAQGILYQIKSAKAEKELDSTLAKKNATDVEIRKLAGIRDSLNKKIDTLRGTIAQATIAVEQSSEELSSILKDSKPEGEFKKLQQNINAAAIDLRASNSSYQPAKSIKPLMTVIEELFGSKASVRGAAYNQIMEYYSNRPELIPSLLEYAYNHLDNQNGIYNTLVVLGHLDYRNVSRDIQAIRVFAEKTRNNGPKTSERVDKLLQRLPK